MGKLDRNRRKLHQGPDELFARVLVRFFAFLSHGRASRLQSQRQADPELLAGERDEPSRGYQWLQGRTLRVHGDAQQKNHLECELLSGAGTPRPCGGIVERTNTCSTGPDVPGDYASA